MKLYRNWIINEVARAGEHTNERTYVRTYSHHTYVRDRPYIPSTTLLCEGIISRTPRHCKFTQHHRATRPPPPPPGCLDVFTLIYPFFFSFSLSLGEARFRLEYCLKGSLLPKQGGGGSGGAKVLGKLPVSGRPTNLDYSRARAYCACSRCGWGLFGHFFSHLSLLFSFSLSLGDGPI